MEMSTMLRAVLGGIVVIGAVCPLRAQTDWENPVKKMLREDKPVIGATLTVPSAEVAVQAASLGFDFLWIEMEHSAITLETARNMVLATRGSRAVPFIRVPVNELWAAKRALDIGALGVIFPFTSTPELARQAADACRYPPNGKRGYGPGLATLRWPIPNYAEFADNNVICVVIIEQPLGVENIEEIASVPGIDVIFIGPADLSFQMGYRGRRNDTKYNEAIAKVVAACKRHKVPVGLSAGPESIQDYIKQGFRFFQTASDLGLMRTGAQPLFEVLGRPLGESKVLY